ncbi:MAG: flavin reductase family protein [Candidatus Heimdallarchaeota archaeon]
MKKVDYPIDKARWNPSLIPGPIVLISTYNTKKEPNVAPKSWLQMVSFEPPMLMFSGSKGNTTENNILETECFGVNFVDSSMASTVYECIHWYGQERIHKAGFTLVKALKIAAPLVAECKAHLECRLHSSQEIGSGFVIFGEIIAASIWEAILQVEHEERYKLLDQILFLEDAVYSRISRMCKVPHSHKNSKR